MIATDSCNVSQVTDARPTMVAMLTALAEGRTTPRSRRHPSVHDLLKKVQALTLYSITTLAIPCNTRITR